MLKGQKKGESSCIRVKCSNDECECTIKVKPSVWSKNEYKMFCCSHKCRSSISYREKYSKKFEELNGYSNVFQRDDVKEKIKEYWKDELGVDNVSKSFKTIKRIKDVCLEKYGASNYMKVPGVGKEMFEKRKETGIELLGAMPKIKTEQTLMEKYGTMIPYNLKHIGTASKASLKYFIPLYKKLRKSEKFNKNDIHWGIKGSKEWYFYDKESGKRFLYDFTIEPLKLIFEYHGEKFHPNPIKLTEEEWNTWSLPFIDNKITADEKYLYDQYKKEVAEKNGFSVVELWSNNTYEENWNLLYESLKGV